MNHELIHSYLLGLGYSFFIFPFIGMVLLFKFEGLPILVKFFTYLVMSVICIATGFAILSVG